MLAVILAQMGCIKNKETAYPAAIKGRIDLSFWDFDSNGSISIDGQWEFYWKSLLTPSDFRHGTKTAMTGFIKLPGLWKDKMINSTPISRMGYATYRLRTKVKPNRQMALFLNNPLSVCKLWINGSLVAQSGEPGTSKETERPQTYMILPYFTSVDGNVDIILQVSNFHNIQGGIFNSILLGTQKDIHRGVEKKLIIAALLSAAIFVLFLYHLFQYLVRRSEKTNLYFGIYCLMIAISSAFGDRGICLIAQLFSTLPWRVSVDLALLPHGLAIPCFVMAYHSIFPWRYGKIVERCYQIFGASFILYILLTPTNAFDPIVFIYQLCLITIIPYLFSRFVADYQKGAEGIKLLIPSYILFLFAVINDLFHDLGMINTGNLVPFATICLILSYSILIQIRIANAYASVKNLSVALEEKNLSLIKANAIKDQFLANTSHELRTPLNGIVGIAESLIKGTVGNLAIPVADNLAIISASGRRLLNLINDILDFSMVKKRNVRLNRQKVNLRSVVDVVLTSTRILASRKGIILDNNVPHSMSYLYADNERLQQILFNLIENAIKFTNQGRVEVTAKSEKAYICICVIDTGIGIAPENFSAIFRSFEQVENKSTTPNRGIGLGLSLTKHLVEIYGGTLEVRSQVAKGSTFTFTVPKWKGKPVEAPAVVSKKNNGLEIHLDHYNQDQPKIENAPEGSAYILVVDDDPGNLHVVCNYLAFLETKVVTCLDGQRALDTIKKQGKPSLVLMDIMMPGMTGYDACKEIRKDFSISELPVIMLTARINNSDIVTGFESGANDYLVKPFSGDEFIARVQTNLKLENSHKILTENIKLKREIKLRQETESQLRVIQKRLTDTLGFSDDAILAVNESNEISFCNHAFEKLSGYEADELLGQPFSLLIPQKFHHLIKEKQKVLIETALKPENLPQNDLVRFITKQQEIINKKVLYAVLEMDEGPLLIVIVSNRLKLTDGITKPLVSTTVINTLNENRDRRLSFEDSLSFISTGFKDPSIKEGLELIDTHLKAIAKTGNKPNKMNERDLGVTVMNLAVDYWSFATKTNKTELADRSKLWSIYLEKDGFARTQTLDRYLNEKTIPLRPRWKNIINTADYVLAECHKPSHLKDQLEKHTILLKEMIRF